MPLLIDLILIVYLFLKCDIILKTQKKQHAVNFTHYMIDYRQCLRCFFYTCNPSYDTQRRPLYQWSSRHTQSLSRSVQLTPPAPRLESSLPPASLSPQGKLWMCYNLHQLLLEILRVRLDVINYICLSMYIYQYIKSFIYQCIQRISNENGLK